MICEKCEVKFYYQNKRICSQVISVVLLEKGFLDTLTESYLNNPIYPEKRFNIQVIPIKKDFMDLDFRNNEILMEAC